MFSFFKTTYTHYFLSVTIQSYEYLSALTSDFIFSLVFESRPKCHPIVFRHNSIVRARLLIINRKPSYTCRESGVTKLLHQRWHSFRTIPFNTLPRHGKIRLPGKYITKLVSSATKDSQNITTLNIES